MKDKYSERVWLERKILASLIMDYDGLIDFLDINIWDFQPKHREIIKAMKESQSTDPTIIASKTQNVSIDEIWDITTEIFSANQNDFEWYVESLKEIIERETLENKINNIAIKLKWWVSLNSIYEDIWDLKVDKTEVSDGEVLYELLQEVSGEKEVKIISTWYKWLDNLVWGYEPWQVVVIWARPWIWKSMFAINLMNNNILAWEKVALFSLEMDRKQVYRRLLSMNSWISVWKLKHKAEWEALNRVQIWFQRLEQQAENCQIFDNVHTIWEMERKIRMLVHKYWTSIVYIDYLQLIRNPNVKNNPVESITDMSQRLKQLALELKITIVELSQLNRDADNSVIQKASQLRGSGSIEQDADMIWILQKVDEDSEILNVGVKKCRDGRIWDVDLIQTSDIMLIKDKPLPSKPF